MAAVENRTPTSRALKQHLEEYLLPPRPSQQQCQEFLEAFPHTDPETRRFVKERIFAVPPSAFHFQPFVCKEKGAYERLDFREQFRGYLDRNARALVFNGPRHMGKTCSVAHEVVELREQVYKARELCAFYDAGRGGTKLRNLDTVYSPLAHMGIVCIFTHRERLKIQMPSRNLLQPMSFFFLTSTEAAVAANGRSSFQAVELMGVHMVNALTPPLALVAKMAAFRGGRNGKVDDAVALDILRRVTLYGYRLDLHHHEDTPASIEYLLDKGIVDVTASSGDHLTAICSMAAGKENLSDYRTELDELASRHIVRKKPGYHEPVPWQLDAWEFADPRLQAWQLARMRGEDLESIEGKVLGNLLRSTAGLLRALLTVLDLDPSQIPDIYSGRICKGADIGGLWGHCCISEAPEAIEINGRRVACSSVTFTMADLLRTELVSGPRLLSCPLFGTVES
ncbi:hypothetical protein WJX73_003453 [Symbiochloris irregularis]|uniref:Uncharacterized protein n=1 Tax=Symbiochloris irregularis TaxID=706552 RepID=A0AAW1NR25_9CHLO